MTGNNGPEKTPYRFTHGNVENVGSLTKRQIDLIEAIIDGQLTEYIDEVRAGRNAFPRRGGDGGMTLRDYFAAQTITMLMRTEELNGGIFPTVTDETRAARAYAIADAMLKERAK